MVNQAQEVVNATVSDLVNEFLGRLRHEDTITPGGTACVHVLRGLRGLFAVRVAEQKDQSMESSKRNGKPPSSKQS